MEEDALICLGTQPIEVQWNSSTIPGMLAAFLPDDQANELIEIIITDGTSTFRGSIPTNDVKGGENWHQQGKTPREALVSCLLRERQGNNNDDDSESKKSNLTFMYKGLEDSLKIVIKGETPNGLVLSLWTGVLQKMNTQDKLSFARISGMCLNVEQAKNSQLTKRIHALEMDVRGWKDTVSKLEETTWQTEKDELLQRFLVLYNQSKAELRNTKQQVERLEEERKQKSRTQQPQVPAVATKSPFTVFHDDEADDDDDDVEPYDPELVAQLAAGPSKQAAKAPMTRVNPVDTSSRVSSSSSPSKKTRINPHTGAIEVWDASTIFDDDDNDTDASAEKESSQSRRREENEDSSTDQRPLKRSRTAEDDSETGDEDD